MGRYICRWGNQLMGFLIGIFIIVIAIGAVNLMAKNDLNK